MPPGCVTPWAAVNTEREPNKYWWDDSEHLPTELWRLPASVLTTANRTCEIAVNKKQRERIALEVERKKRQLQGVSSRTNTAPILPDKAVAGPPPAAQKRKQQVSSSTSKKTTSKKKRQPAPVSEEAGSDTEPNESSSSEDEQEETTIMSDLKVSKRTYEKLKSDLKELRKELSDQKKENNKLGKATSGKDKSLKDALAQVESLKNDKVGLEKALEEAETALHKIMDGKKKKSMKPFWKQDVCLAIDPFVRDILTRTYKFANSTKVLRVLTKKVWDKIKDKLKLEEGSRPMKYAKFEEIYLSYVKDRINYHRHYVQSCTQAASKGTILVDC